MSDPNVVVTIIHPDQFAISGFKSTAGKMGVPVNEIVKELKRRHKWFQDKIRNEGPYEPKHHEWPNTFGDCGFAKPTIVYKRDRAEIKFMADCSKPDFGLMISLLADALVSIKIRPVFDEELRFGL